MDLMDEELEKQGEIQHDDDEDLDNYPEALEVYLLMNHKFRVSRTRRMNWFLDYFDNISELSEPERGPSKPFNVVGLNMKNGFNILKNDKFRISTNTKCLFFSKFYKTSFILDLSPTAFTADNDGSIIYTNILPTIFKLIKEMITPFIFPNSKIVHKSEVFVTLFAFSPFIHFEKMPTLIHGFRVNETSFNEFKKLAEENFQNFLDNLLIFMEPLNLLKDKLIQQQNTLIIPEEEEDEETLTEKKKKEKQTKEEKMTNGNGNEKLGKGKEKLEEKNEMEKPKKEEKVKNLCKKNVEENNKDKQEGEEEDDVFNEMFEQVAIDFRLLQMIRMGMLGLYNGPENCQPGLFIVTDGILYIPETQIIQSIATNLRTNCVPLFFIQISAVNHGPSVGLVSSDELLTFLSEISFGKFMNHIEINNFNRIDTNVSEIQKSTLSWSCQEPSYQMEQALNVVCDDPARIRKQESIINSNFYSLFHVRIREGYSLVKLDILPKGEENIIIANFRLPWTVDCTIDYQISADYIAANDEKIHKIRRLVKIETNYVPPNPEDPQDSGFTAGKFLTESEQFALRVINFSSHPTSYEIQKQLFHKYPGLYAFTKESYPFPLLLIKSVENSKFNVFWQPFIFSDNSALHRCSHVISSKFVIQYCQNLRPETNYWNIRQPDGVFPIKEIALNAIHEYFKQNTSFCLVTQYAYVKIEREGRKSPTHCYIVKIFLDSMLLTIKTIFIGDCSLDVRMRTINQIKRDLLNLEKCPNVIHPIANGIDAKLLKYRKKITELSILQPLYPNPTVEIWESRLNIHRGTLIRFLLPKRIIWKIEKGIGDERCEKVALESMSLLIQRRILEGFKIVFEENGIINMIKEIPSEIPILLPKYEQFIIFPPTFYKMVLKGEQVRKLREQLNAIGRTLEIQKTEQDENLESPTTTTKDFIEIEEKNDSIDDENMKNSTEMESPGFQSLDNNVFIETQKMTLKERRKLKKEKHKKEEVEEIPVKVPIPDVPVDDEVYSDVGSYIITEHWTEPVTMLIDEAGLDNRYLQVNDDKTSMSVLMTFRSMQSELEMAPGIGTALIGKEAYVMHKTEPSPIKLAKDVDYYPFLYNIINLCFYGERTLVLLPTLKFIHTDPHSIDRLGKILDSFNHEMKNYMPQSFDFEDKDHSWDKLSSGLKKELMYIDRKELEEVEQASFYDYETDVERILDDEDTPGTGYSSPGATSLPSGTRSLSNQMAGMEMKELTRSILGGFDTRTSSCGSGDKLIAPKPISESRSTSALLEVDDDENVEFMPSKKKVTNTLNTSNLNCSNDSDIDSKTKTTKKKKNKNKHGGSTMSLGSGSEKSKRKTKSTLSEQAPLGFTVYYKRRDSKTVMIVIIPATCRTVLKITNRLVPKLPVLTFLIEEDRLLDILRTQKKLPQDFRKTNIENFCTRGPLAYLNWQINAKLSESEREISSPSNPFNFEIIEDGDPTFANLNSFCVNIMHDLIFSRAYVQAAYHCLGTNIHVPQIVLEEVLEERCMQTIVKLGSIKDVLKITCTHLSSLLQSKRVSRYQRHQMPSISSSSSSESEYDLQQMNEYQFMNPFCYSESENDEICRMERKEFRIAFENVLRQHKFFKVPNFNDYYFYWPNGDNTVSLFNSGGVWNERRRNDKNDDENSITSSDSSAITVLSENGSENENNFDDENDVNFDIEPLFLQFYVNIPKQEITVSYPVDFIPNCLKETLNRCDNNDYTTNDKTILDEYNVQIEMHVLTVSTIESINNEKKENDDEIFEKNTIDNLEFNQKQIILNLEKGIRHMLEMEKILILSRYFDQQRSYKNISRVLKFIENESKKYDDYPRILTAQSDMLFVIKPNEGLKKLCNKLENSMVGYCKIRSIQSKIDNSIIFYSCSVEDLDIFCKEHNLESNFVKFDFKPKRRQRIQGEKNDDEIYDDEDCDDVIKNDTTTTLKNDELLLESDDEVIDINLKLHDDNSLTNLDEQVKRKQILHDFWLMAKIEPDPMKIKNYFFQRQNGLHEILFKKFTDKFVEEIKNVNQILLLEDMAKTEECSLYLIQEDKPLKTISSTYDQISNLSDYAKKFFIKPSEVDENLISDDDSSADDLDSIKYAYSPGYFFCPLLWYHWFEINPRLRFESKGKSVDRGWRTLQEEMGNFNVKNRKNLYVFKEKDGNVVYIYLFSNAELAIRTINNPKMESEIRQKMKNSILFAVFGIKNPGEAITNELITRLQRKLDNRVMEELQLTILKNPNLLLKSTDISFIQPDLMNPVARFYFSLPTIVADYLASVHQYLKQHLSIHYIRPSFLEDKTFAGKCYHFKPFPNDGLDPLPENYDEIIFMVNKPKAEGQRTKGIGCFEIRIIDKTGKMISKSMMKNGKLNADSFSLLYPGFSGNSMIQKTAKFHELTKTVQLETLEIQSGSINSNYFVETFVWQSGDIGLEELQTKLRISIQQALADLIVEFGILSQTFLEISSTIQTTTTSTINRPTTLIRQSAVDQKITLRKRNSTLTTETPTTNILNVANYLNTGSPSPNNSIFDFNSSIKSPIIPIIQSPKIETTRFPFDSSTTSLTDIGHGKVHWKSSEDTTPSPNCIFNITQIPNLPSCNPEMLKMDFIPVVTSFFYYNEREARAYPDMVHSFQKFKFTLECQHETPTIFRVLYAKFVELFRSCNDSIMVFKPFITKEGNKRLQSVVDTDSLTPTAIYLDHGNVVDLVSENYTDIDTAIVVYNKQQMDSSIKQSLKEKDEPISPDLINLEVFPHESYLKFGPITEPFVPRRRLFFILAKAETITLFLYNVKHETTLHIKDIIDKTVLWNNVRSCLLRNIGLHKMQFTHLTTLKKSEKYQNIMWKNPEIVITNDYPPDEIKLTDYTKMPKQFTRNFMKIYRYFDSAFISKNLSSEKFTDQATQFLNMKKEFKQDLNDFHLFQNIHKQLLDSGDSTIQLDEEKLKRLMKRCENAHYVETPLLLFPEWRTKVATIRIGENDYGSVRKRKQSAPSKSINSKKHSMEAKMKPRSRTMTDAQPPILPVKSPVEEPCSLKIQYMLAQEYSKYLEKYLGAKLLKIKSSTPDLYSLTYSANITTSPIVWLQMTHPGGIFLMNLYFDEPYFCIKILFWNRSILLEEQNIVELRSFIKAKNQIVSKCHIHSFTYDFHLRMVSTYLIGGTQVLFNRGYNTSAFLIDFLQYYNCRPPSARNCIFEEDCPFDKLKVPGNDIWENFLKNAKKYSWDVVRLKTLDKEGKDEYMLVSTVPKEIFGQKYEGIRLITNVSKAKGVDLKEPRLVIRYYVMMVSAEIENPMLDTPVQLMDTNIGEFVMKDQKNNGLVKEIIESDGENLDFGPDPEINYDSDARQSSGSNSDRSQLAVIATTGNKNRMSEQSLTLSSTGNEFSDRTSSDNDEMTIKDINSPCPSPMSNTLVDSMKISTILDTNELNRKLSKPVIQKIPPRGHRKHSSISNELKFKGAIPPEQVTYVHYYNQLQKNLQKALEEFAKTSKEELYELVSKSDSQCHVELLWRKLLSTNSINQRKSQMTVFQQIGSKLDLMDANQLLKQVLSTDLSMNEWTVFSNIIKIVDMSSEEPRLESIFANQSYLPVFKFLVVHFEGEKRCRYFDFPKSKNLIITNPSCLDCATLFEFKIPENQLKLFMLFKEHKFNEPKSDLFSRNAIHKQFEEIMQCLAAFMWSDLLNKRLTL